MGRYQQRKAQGVKITNHRIERPKSTPLLLSTKNQARQASRFRNRVTECTVEDGGDRRGLVPRWLRAPGYGKLSLEGR